jgi:hypothetical protein
MLRRLFAAGHLTIAAAVLLAAPAGVAAVSGGHEDHNRALAAQAAATPAIDLRVGLGRLLGEHAFLLMEATRAEASSPDREAFVAAIAENSAALQGAIAGVYGDRAASAFSRLWQRHIEQLLAYADARRSGDRSAERSAEARLTDVSAALGELLADLNPGVDHGVLADAMRTHIDHITAFSDEDYADAYAAHRASFRHMFALGDTLALDIVRQNQDVFPDAAAAFSPRVDLRLALDRLLGEHLVLAALAMRAGVNDAPDVEAAAASLEENTGDLARALGDIYGTEAAAQFREVWSAHVTAYLDFVQALGANDEAGRTASLTALHAYHEQIATLFAEVNPQLERDQVADLIRRHVQALITQAEATQAGDPARAIAATRDGYEGTFEVGAVVADAVAKQFPERYPERRRLPSTDVAPTEVPLARWFVVLIAVVLSLSIQIALVARLRALRSNASRSG